LLDCLDLVDQTGQNCGNGTPPMAQILAGTAGPGHKPRHLRPRAPCPAVKTVYIGPSFADVMNRAASRGGAAKDECPAYEMRLDRNRRAHAAL
jgi:hypothetical protein